MSNSRERLKTEAKIEAIGQAQKLALKHPFDKDAIVAHPDHPRALKYQRTEDGVDILLDLDPKSGAISELRYPAGKLFDPNVAEEIAVQIFISQYLHQLPDRAN